MSAPPAEQRRRYLRYLRSRAWKEKRLQSIRRAHWRCEVCGRRSFDERDYQVHHITYDHFGDERPEELMALCRRCHRKLSR